MRTTDWERMTINARSKSVYIAMSRIESPMLNSSDGVKMEGPYSGTGYRETLRGGKDNTTGAPISSEWVSVFYRRGQQYPRQQFPKGFTTSTKQLSRVLPTLAGAEST